MQEHWLELRPPTDLQLRGGRERAIAAVTEAIYARANGPPPAERVAWVTHRVRDFVSSIGGKAAFAFQASLMVVEWIAPLYAFTMPPFRRLSLERRLKVVERWEHSPFGITLFALKMFTAMHYFEHPEVANETGFDAHGLLVAEEEE